MAKKDNKGIIMIIAIIVLFFIFANQQGFTQSVVRTDTLDSARVFCQGLGGGQIFFNPNLDEYCLIQLEDSLRDCGGNIGDWDYVEDCEGGDGSSCTGPNGDANDYACVNGDVRICNIDAWVVVNDCRIYSGKTTPCETSVARNTESQAVRDCTDEQQQCDSHDYVGCHNGDKYWYDSCGGIEEIRQSCGGHGCSNGVCIQSTVECVSDNECSGDDLCHLPQNRCVSPCELLQLSGVYTNCVSVDGGLCSADDLYYCTVGNLIRAFDPSISDFAYFCSISGTFVNPTFTTCPNGCSNGMCENRVCLPDATWCDSNVIKTCSSNGMTISTVQTCGGVCVEDPAPHCESGENWYCVNSNNQCFFSDINVGGDCFNSSSSCQESLSGNGGNGDGGDDDDDDDPFDEKILIYILIGFGVLVGLKSVGKKGE